MIGNDIVDLQLAEIESNWERKGFLEKQFTLKEQQEIKKSKNPFLKVWLFWSMKEAAYKCYTQKIEKRFFAPQKFECTQIKEKKGVVTFEEHKFYTITFFSRFYIHTISDDNFEQIRVFSAIGAPNLIDQDLKKILQQETAVSYKEIEKKKTENGAPMFYHKEELLTKSCSISHHGNYGAFAFALK
jgi:phosphopantetheinyl transferase (holo-ACP synthase)